MKIKNSGSVIGVENKNLEVSIVVINWNGEEYILKTLESIFSNIKFVSFEVLLIDNNSKDNSINLIKLNFPNIEVHILKRNYGFAIANNQAIKYCKGEYILLLNSDTLILKKGIVDLIRFAKLHPNAGAIGGRVLSPDRTIQYTCNKFPNFAVYLLKHTICIIKNLNLPIFYPYGISKLNYDHSLEVDWVSGCYMLIHKDIINSLGLFDENIFMYGEDIELCYKIRKNSYKVYYVYASPIIHYGGVQIKKHTIGKSIWDSFSSSQYLISKNKNLLIGKIFKMLVLKSWVIFFIIFGILRNLCRSNKKIVKKYELFKELLQLSFKEIRYKRGY